MWFKSYTQYTRRYFHRKNELGKDGFPILCLFTAKQLGESVPATRYLSTKWKILSMHIKYTIIKNDSTMRIFNSIS